MDNVTFSKWVEQVLKRYRKGKPRCLLVIDSGSAHKCVRSKAVLEETKMKLSFIPGEYTAVFQAVDAGFMRAFKTYYEEVCQNMLVTIEMKRLRLGCYFGRLVLPRYPSSGEEFPTSSC